jgi:patatin-related protein
MYRVLLGAAGYSEVTIDVLSGASAGGLNGALMSSTLMYGVDFADMKQVWLKIADIEALMRSPQEPTPDSILMGDDYFLPRMKEILERMISRARSEHKGFVAQKRLDLWLATTLVWPTEALVYDDWAGRYTEKSQAAVFHFRQGPYGSDFRVDRSGDSIGAVAYRLALAARSSSSFPGAFEPATIRVDRPKEVGKRPGTAKPEDMFGIFSDSSRPAQYVMDGGVLDNIPVGRAIRSIAAATAEGPTERWLLFLHPSPEEGTESVMKRVDEEPGKRPDTLRTVLESLQASTGRESLLDDITILREHNAAALRHGFLRTAMLERLLEDGLEGIIDEAGKRYDEYVRLRADFAAARIRHLLDDPVTVLGEDPFTNDRFRTPLGALNDSTWSQQRRFELQRVLAGALRDPPPWPGSEPTDDIGLVHKLGVPPLLRAIDTLIGFLRSLQQSDESAELREAKGNLYALRNVVELLHHMSDLFWAVYACEQSSEPTDAWAEGALRAREQFLRYYWNQSRELSLNEIPEAVRITFRSLRAELCEVWEDFEDRDDDIVRDLWNRLAASVREIAELLDSTDLLARLEQEDDGSDPQTLLLAQGLAAVAGTAGGAGRGPRSVKFLAALEILFFPLDMTAPTGRQYIHFLRIAGTNVTPLEDCFPGGKLSLKDKLAGNELNNFSAFYKESWRANDWMWGRMDAATSLIDLVVRPEAIRSQFIGSASTGSADRVDDFVNMIGNLVTGEVSSPIQLSQEQREQWRLFFKGLWDRYRSDVEAEAQQLFGGATTDGDVLDKTKEVLTARRHWDVLIWELKDVVATVMTESMSEGQIPESSFRQRMRNKWNSRTRQRLKDEPLMQAVLAVESLRLDPLREPKGMKELLSRYAVGRETVMNEMGTDRFTRIVANLAVVAWNALPGRLGIAVLKPVGGVVRLMRLLALAIANSRKWALALLLTLIALASYAAVHDQGWLGGRFVSTVILLGATGLLFYGASNFGRLVLAAILIGLAGLAASQVSGTIAATVGDRTLRLNLTESDSVILVLVLLALIWLVCRVRALIWIARKQTTRQRKPASRSANPKI